MFHALNTRCGHYALLLTAAVALTFPNLGACSLWDIDEGNNAEAAREMLDCGNWVVPTHNYQLRVDKPALLYWLQISAFGLFGINEFAARLPSALAALAAVLMTYELGRRMFGAATGLLAGLVLATTGLFCAAAHFANPDALLNAATLLTLFFFWRTFSRPLPLPLSSTAADQGRGRERAWSVASGISAGVAVLAKGPVGLVLPVAIIGLFLLWSRKARLLWEWRLLGAALAFVLVAVPWYVWVGVETKIAFLNGFILQHNIGRYLHPMEHHSGPVFYYLGVLALGFAPWSVFLGLAGWYATGKRAREDDPPSARLSFQPAAEWTEGRRPGLPAGYRFLWCWIAVTFGFFSLASTKLPNYILPLYPPLAILTAHFLQRWRAGTIRPPAWVLHLSIAGFALVGVATSLALLIAAGTIPIPALHGFPLAGLRTWAALGIVPVLGAAAAWRCLYTGHRSGLVLCVTVASIAFIGGLFTWGSVALDAYKAPRALVQTGKVQQTDREIRVGCYQYFQPSLVFYCRREVRRLENDEQVLEFLRSPLPTYLFLPATVWERLQTSVRGAHHLLARHSDLYRRCEVVIVANH
ncbi:MAG TPA: glycosyltransferase family 39 protein [Gemmataceae bacterium]|nr:glycosyltransferase family 39 protein [Gemmataceae bacterium]